MEFKDVAFRPTLAQVSSVAGVNLALGRGEIGLVILEEGRENNPLASLAQGLLQPECGQVLFLGEDWSQLAPSRLSFLRGRIRRVYEHYGWITNLDVMENICLAELYHTSRATADIEHEAGGLARRFGIDPIPDIRPSRVHGMTLRKLEWVRAFLGEPDLILLERPCFGAPKADAAKLVQAANEAARRGVAVLWLTDDPHILDDPGMADARRYRMDGETVKAV